MKKAKKIKKSRYSIEEWLNAVTRAESPRGEHVKITNVNDGDVVDVCFAGSQSFGSGGYSAGAEYAGKPPVFVGGIKNERSKFASASWGKFQLFNPSVVYHWEVDYCCGRRVFRNEVFVCAAVAQKQKEETSASRNKAEADKKEIACEVKFRRQEYPGVEFIDPKKCLK